jgi:hypothetical protein
MTPAEIQNTFEAEISSVTGKLVGRGGVEDWALIRALVHKAMHIAVDQRADYCAVTLLLAEMTQHAHALMHPAHATATTTTAH